MTDPDHFTMIPNLILDKLYNFRIPGEERLCFDYIIRKTYGYGKHEDMISNSQFVKATGMRKGNVSRALKTLVDKKIVIKNDNKRIATYRINEKITSWKLLSKKQPVIKNETIVIKRDNDLLSKVRDTKERKETIQNKDVCSEDLRLANLFYQLIKNRNPNHKKPDLNSWASHIAKIHRIDKRPYEEIESVIVWVQNDTPEKHQGNGKWPGWANNILSAQKLREKFDTVLLKIGTTPDTSFEPQYVDIDEMEKRIYGEDTSTKY